MNRDLDPLGIQSDEVTDAEYVSEVRREMWLRMRAEWPAMLLDFLIEGGGGFMFGVALGFAALVAGLQSVTA